MDPISGTLLLQAGSAAASGIAGYSKAKADQRNARINSFIGRTRAIQTDTVARQSLSDELGSIRNVLGANEQAPGVGTFEVMKELRGVRDRERRIEFGSRMSESADFRRAGQNAGTAAIGSLIGGAINAGPSIFDFAQYRRRQNGSS